MEDKPTPEEPKKDFNKLDLTQLEGFSFGTEWTKDAPQPDTGPSRRRDDRPRRDGGRDDRRDRRGFKRSSGPVSGGGGNRDRRGGGGGSDRADRGGDRGRRMGGPKGDRRGGGNQGPQPPYVSPYFDVTFYPEDVSFAALAKTIRSSARTFELFDIAKTVIGKNDRFVVVVERKPDQKTDPDEKKPFHVCLLDGMPFESEDAVMNHVVQHHLERFFTISEEETEPPKGSFQVINKCGVTGELLGPPNYHRYNQIVQQHHATRLSRMDFERFSSRIESVRDEEVVQQWLDSMKKVTRFTWCGDGNVPVDLTAKKAESESSPSQTAPVAEETPAEPPPDTPAETASTVVETSETAESGTEPAPVENEAPDSSGVSDSTAEPGPVFDSTTDAKVHLITHARDKVVRTYEHSRFHGRILDNMPDGEIKRSVIGALERQRRFPLDTANALRGRLRREGFTIFKKGSKGISYVSAVKRKFRVAGQTFADSINDLINFIEQHPMVKVSELTEKFLGITPPESPAKSGDAPTATTPGTVSPFGEADQPRIKRMQVDLRWLVTEGYVTEFIDGSLFAAAPMPAPKPKPAAKETAPTKPATVETAAPAANENPAAGSAPEVAEATTAPVSASEPAPEPTPDLPAEAAEPAEQESLEPVAEPQISEPEVGDTQTTESSVVEAPSPETPPSKAEAPAESNPEPLEQTPAPKAEVEDESTSPDTPKSDSDTQDKPTA